MDITKKLLEQDPTLTRHNEGDWENPYNPDKQGFSSFNDAGIEVETGEFLYALTRLLKPDYVLETGTHWGVGAAYMGSALKENGHGTLVTLEFLPEIHKRAVERLQKLGLHPFHVVAHRVDARLFEPTEKYKLILLDTEPQTRFGELLKFYDNLEEGGFVFIHDLHPHMHQIPNEEHGFAWPFGEIPAKMLELVRTGKLRPMHFPTPRGLTGFYKPASGDYDWTIKKK